MELKSESITKSRYVVCAISILVLALLIRSCFVFGKDVTGDEANYIMIAKCSMWEMISGKALDPSNPPLYMIFLRALMLLCPNQMWLWKLTTAMMNILMVCLIIVLLQRQLGYKIALIAGFLAAINPFQIFIATELRGYAMVGLCSLIAIDAGERFKRNGFLVWAIVWGLSCAAGFWTHYSMAAVALVTGFDTLIHVRKRLASLVIWLVAGGVSLGLMVLWMWVMLRQNIHPGGAAAHVWHLAGFGLVQCLGTTYLRPELPLVWIIIGSLPALVVFGSPLLVGVLTLWREKRSMFLMFFCLFLVTIIAPLVRSFIIGSLSFSTRYTFVASITIFLLLAAGLASLSRALRIIMMAGIILLSAISTAQFRWKYLGRTVEGQMTSKVMDSVKEDEAILLPSAIEAMRIRYYSNGGFPHCFAGLSERDLNMIEQGATWAQAHNERVGATIAKQQFHAFKVVWYWNIGDTIITPPMLKDGYRIDHSVLLAKGGQFGIQRTVQLVRYERLDNQKSRGTKF